MNTKTRSEQLDEIFQRFIYDGLKEDEAQMLRESSQSLTRQLEDAADNLKGLLADREGREAFAKALAEGRKNG
jgi:hypothetical protein